MLHVGDVTHCFKRLKTRLIRRSFPNLLAVPAQLPRKFGNFSRSVYLLYSFSRRLRRNRRLLVDGGRFL